MAVLYAGNPAESIFWGETQAAARALDVTLQSYRVQDPSEFEGAFAAMTKAKVEALLVQQYPFMLNNARRFVELAAQSRLPAMYPHRQAVQAGGLMSYDVNLADNFRRLGLYVAKIFNGANPGDLPVDQPTKFDLLINLKTAKTLGLTIPQSLLMRADEVFE